MAATLAGAIKAHLEAQGLGISVYRDRPPSSTAKPYVTVQDGISIVPDLSGDFGSATAVDTVSELAQVDVWQQARDPVTNAVTESYTLVPAVARALHGAVLSAAPTHVHGTLVQGSVRLLEDEDRVVHTAITVQVRRVL